MDVLPRDIKQYEIITRLDCVSKMALRKALLGQDYPKLTNDQQKKVISYGLEFAKSFWHLLDKTNVNCYAPSMVT